MKKRLLFIAAAVLTFSQMSAQIFTKIENPDKGIRVNHFSNPEFPISQNRNEQNREEQLKNGQFYSASNFKNNLKRGDLNKPTGTEYRVTALYFLEYNGAQYEKINDSTHFFFSGTRSYKDVFGVDADMFILNMALSEFTLPAFPQYLTSYPDVTDSIHTIGINGAGTEFDDLNRRSVNVFDANGNITETIGREVVAGVWQNDYKDVYNITNNQISERINQDWVSGAWENSYREVSTYDGNGNLQEFTELQWSSGAWVNNYNYLYQYDVNGNCISQIDRVPNGSSWDNDAKYEIVYDANNKVTGMIYSQWTSGAWEEKQNLIFAYDGNGNTSTLVLQVKSGSSWVDDSRLTYTFSANQKNNYLAESFDGTVWNKVQNNIYTYNSSGNLDNAIMQSWDNGASAWKNENKIIPEYDSLDLTTGLFGETWNAGGFWEKTTGSLKYRFFYDSYQTTGIKDQNLSIAHLVIYPNPASNTLFLNLNWEQITNCSLSIIDLNGRIYSSQKMLNVKDIQTKLDISELPAGTYFLKVSTQTGEIAKGFQVVK